jgi:putative MATE family efflux protein
MTPSATHDATAPLASEAWRLAIPMVVLGWIRASWLAVDAWWVAGLGETALTGLAAAAFAWWMVDQLAELAGLGTQSRIAQAIGAGTPEAVDRIVAEGLVVATLLGLCVTGTAELWAPLYVRAMGLTDDVARAADAVLHGLAWLAPVAAVSSVVQAVFRGIGDTRAALSLSAAVLVVNAVLSPLVLFNAGFGVGGAPLATALAVAAGVVASGGVLRQRGWLVTWSAPTLAGAARTLGIGGPVFLSGIGFSLVYVLLGRLIAAQGDVHLAALGVGHRLESYAYLACTGFSVASATLVGRATGAGDRLAARRAGLAIGRLSGRVMLAAGALAWLLAPTIFAAFSDDPALVASGTAYLRAQAAVWVFMAWEITYEGSFAGLGDTFPASVTVTIGTLARLPLAVWVTTTTPLGATGIWLVVAATTATKGALLRGWFLARTVVPRDEIQHTEATSR